MIQVQDPCVKTGVYTSKGSLPNKTLDTIDEGVKICQYGHNRLLPRMRLYILHVLKAMKNVKKYIACAAGVTEVTIRNRYKGIVDELDITL